MFDKIGDAAEKLAINVSRRAFLGRLGQGAFGLAAAIVSVLAFPREAQASELCCFYSTPSGCCCFKPQHPACPRGGVLVDCKRSCYQNRCGYCPGGF
jgi:hypothetical protein